MAALHRPFSEADHEADSRQSASLAALAVTLFLIVVSLFLIEHLRAEAVFQDCVLSGHAGCLAPGDYWPVR